MEDKKVNIIKESIRSIPDYPKKGIMFRDITTLLKDAEAFGLACDCILEYSGRFPAFDYVAGIESRGFIFGAILANMLNKGFIPVRKPGKLPAQVNSMDYELEYGKDTVEVHVDAIIAGAGYLLVDDLLATGGTALASCQLIENCGGVVSGCVFVIDLPDLEGRKKLKDRIVWSVVQFEGE